MLSDCNRLNKISCFPLSGRCNHDQAQIGQMQAEIATMQGQIAALQAQQAAVQAQQAAMQVQQGAMQAQLTSIDGRLGTIVHSVNELRQTVRELLINQTRRYTHQNGGSCSDELPLLCLSSFYVYNSSVFCLYVCHR